MTPTAADAVLLISIGLLIASGWLLTVFAGPTVAKSGVYALVVAGAVQLLVHPATLSDANAGLLSAGLILAAASLGLRVLTVHQRPTLRAAGRFREVNWRDLAALSLWVGGAGCVMSVVHPLFGPALIAGVATWIWSALRPEAREIRTHVSIEARCDPERAFAMVANPREDSRYIDDLEVDAPTEQEVGVGYRYRWRLRFKEGYVFEDEEEIVEYQPGHRIKERSLRHPPSSATFTVEPPPGGTRIIFDYEGLLSVPQALLGRRPAVVTRLTATRQRIFVRLKELLEERAT